jgi:hypothetical protein
MQLSQKEQLVASSPIKEYREELVATSPIKDYREELMATSPIKEYGRGAGEAPRCRGRQGGQRNM